MRTALLLSAALMSGCTQPETARAILERAGYTQIQMHGYDWFACSKDDTYHDKFTAIGPAGKPVTGVVCAGLLFKGSTIRFD